MSANLYELLSKPFQEFSDSVAIECHERGIWTYGELEEQTARYADWLIGSEVKPGDRVVVQAEKSPEVVFLYLASLKSGAIFLPLNTAYQPAELEFFLSDAEPRIFVCDPKKADHPGTDLFGKRHLAFHPWRRRWGKPSGSASEIRKSACCFKGA